MDIANNRYNVRHVLKKSRVPALNPAITDQESDDFEHDADLLIRSFICSEFKMDCPIINRRQHQAVQTSSRLDLDEEYLYRGHAQRRFVI